MIPAVAASQESRRVLEPLERISEVFAGLIMVLTFAGTLSIADLQRPILTAQPPKLLLLIARQPVTASNRRPDPSGKPSSGTPKAPEERVSRAAG